ncbi:MAG TPA: prepilin-type N-terminal cleavage/methylation domain-containing protein [Blastocatellia bacterium]|nr:prepilin-type N-terminal cleavage/methylation domain-containing protein [Blastocatellia bacterium]
MRHNSEQGFTIVELMIATATLLVVLSAALSFFSRSQVVYTNERGTLDMVQDMRTVFDRFTNEIRMAGAGLPYQTGVIDGSDTTLVVRGDFTEIATIVPSTGSITIAGSTVTFPVGTTKGFKAGQTISLLDNIKGWAVLVKVTAVNDLTKEISVDTSDLYPLSSGATITDFSAGTIINVIERRTYTIKTEGDDIGAITRTVAYENTATEAGETIQAEEVIARNVLDEKGDPGLTFTYLQANGDPAGLDEDGELLKSEIRKVQIGLKARSAKRDLQTGKYRTFNYTALVQIRSQYAPGVGY